MKDILIRRLEGFGGRGVDDNDNDSGGTHLGLLGFTICGPEVLTEYRFTVPLSTHSSEAFTEEYYLELLQS